MNFSIRANIDDLCKKIVLIFKRRKKIDIEKSDHAVITGNFWKILKFSVSGIEV